MIRFVVLMVYLIVGVVVWMMMAVVAQTMVRFVVLKVDLVAGAAVSPIFVAAGNCY